jgi:hypothetical protein
MIRPNVPKPMSTCASSLAIIARRQCLDTPGTGNTSRTMAGRERLLVIDLLESYTLERDADVWIERRDGKHWFCQLRPATGTSSYGSGRSAREAIKGALERAGVHIPA